MGTYRTVPRICRNCGVEYAASIYDKGKFCTRACYWAGKEPFRPLAERFWAMVDKHGPVPEHTPDLGPCWIATGARHRFGYGRIGTTKGKTDVMHRVSWRLNVGPIPPGAHVGHRCDNPPCVRPDHLFLTDNDGNVADKLSKGRQATGERSGPRTHPERLPRGEGHPHAQLTEASVMAMRAAYAAGSCRLIDLADEYGVSLTTVFKVVHRQTWTHI